MNEPPSRATPSSERPDDLTPRSGGLEELRDLLLHPERARIADLQDRLDDPSRRAHDVSRSLPDAVRLRATRDEELATALMPTVATAARRLLREETQAVADALTPVIGPAIRKAIAHALSALVQSLNQAIEHSVSWRGLTWRMEAWRTGVPFAEVVLAHSLIYRVEQVLLIHARSGLLLQHVTAAGIAMPDAEIVSGMLTAIQDFARDSFGAPPGEGLDSLRLGELTVLIARGPEAVLAAVVRGTAPESLRAHLETTVERLHVEHGALLASFAGNAAPLEATRPLLERCLQDKLAEPSQRLSPLLLVVLGLAVLALAAWLYSAWETSRSWHAYLERLATEPGVVVTEARRHRGAFLVSGLRDPLAGDPVELARASGLDPAALRGRWEPYHALDPPLVVARAHRILDPPATTSLALEGTTLVARGSAGHAWITSARTLGAAIPGVVRLDLTQVTDGDAEALAALGRTLEQEVLRFQAGTGDLLAEDAPVLERAIAQLTSIEELARLLDVRVTVRVVGRADASGPGAGNAALSAARALVVLERLRPLASEHLRLESLAAGTSRPLRPEVDEPSRALNRSVSFEVTTNGVPGREARPR